MLPPDAPHLDLQTRFADALRDGSKSAAAIAQFIGEAESVERRLALYRGNVLAARSKALQAAYPVLQQIVGEDFFVALARRYMHAHPSQSGDLNEFGEHLGTFLRGFEAAAELPYLADIAHLEWAVHRAHYAADAPSLPLEAIANTPADNHALLRFNFQAAFALLRSEYPIASIWEIHQDNYTGAFEVDFDKGPYHAIVQRPQWRVTVSAIDAADHALLLALKGGATLGGALEKALLQDPSFDLGRALAQAIEAGLFVACHVEEESP